MIAAVSMLAVVGMLMAAFGARMNEEARIRLGERIGHDMKRVADVVQSFVDVYANELKTGMTTAPASRPFNLNLSNASGRSVTITVRKNDATNVTIDRVGLEQILSLLDVRGVSAHPVAGGHYALRLTFSEPGPPGNPARPCTPRTIDVKKFSACAIDSLLYVAEPIAIRDDTADAMVVYSALKTMGVNAGAAMSPDIGTIRFGVDKSALASTANPVQPYRAGIIGIRGNRADQHQPYMPLSGGAMGGPIDMDQHDISHIEKLTANTLVAGNVTLQGNTLSAKSDLHLKGETISFGNDRSPASVIVSSDGIVADKISAGRLAVASEVTFKKGDLPACDGHKIALNKEGIPQFCAGGEWQILKGKPGIRGPDGANGRTVTRDAEVEYIMHKEKFSMRADPAGFFQGSRTETKNLGRWNKCEITYSDNLDSDRIGIRLVSGDKWEFWAIKYTGGRTSNLEAACYAVKLRSNGRETTLDLNIPVGRWISVPFA